MAAGTARDLVQAWFDSVTAIPKHQQQITAAESVGNTLLVPGRLYSEEDDPQPVLVILCDHTGAKQWKRIVPEKLSAIPVPAGGSKP